MYTFPIEFVFYLHSDLIKLYFFASSRFRGLCNICGHCGLDIHLCGGTSTRTDKHSCVYNNLLCDWSIFSLLCEGFGHHHQRVVGRQACSAAPPGLDPPAQPCGLCEHTDQLSQPGSGHFQHFHCDADILRVLYNFSSDLFGYSF